MALKPWERMLWEPYNRIAEILMNREQPMRKSVKKVLEIISRSKGYLIRKTGFDAEQKKKQIDKIRRMGTFSDEQWADYITNKIHESIRNGKNSIVMIASRSSWCEELEKRMFGVASRREDIHIFLLNVDEVYSGLDTILNTKIQRVKNLENINVPPENTVFVSCFKSNSDVTKSLQPILNHPDFKRSDFIYLIRASDSYSAFFKHDYPLPDFYVSSIFDSNLIDEIYEFSLTKTKLKCQVRDAYDLYQLLLQTRNISGAIAEFGSYRGHSALIISEVVKRLNLQKKIYSCDIFDKFPEEELGVDYFWGGGHRVNYEEVRELFKDYQNVHLVRGDFSETIDTIPEDKFSLVYVDCDSYRATKLVSEKIYPKLSKGGVIIYEDYGHTFCLGCRQAVDEFYEHQEGCFQFFSLFSGLHVVIKMRE